MPPAGWALDADLIRKVFRIPYVHARLLLETPAALIAFVIVAIVLGGLWARNRRASSTANSTVPEVIVGLMTFTLVIWFLHFGQVDWHQTGDWNKDWMYYSAAKQAVTNLTVPYTINIELQGTERYLANLETPWSPDVILLRWMDLRSFFVVHIAWCVLAGCIGLAAIRRELGLSVFSMAVFSLLFVLNGHITSHLWTGHTQWSAYFLIPWVFVCLARCSNGDTSRRNLVALAVTMAVMIAIGGWHVFVWSLLFTMAYGLRSMVRLRFVVIALAIAGGLAAYRLFPALATFGVGRNEYLGGYPLWLLPQALAGDIGRTIGRLEWHEYDAYIGYSGFALMLIGLWPAKITTAIDDLRVPSLVMIGLSLFNIYGQTLFHLPGFVSERVSTRLAIVGFLGLILAGLVRWEQWRQSRPQWSAYVDVTALAAAWFLAMQLILRGESRRPKFDLTALPIANMLKAAEVSSPYFWMIWIGCVVSIASAALVWRRSFSAGVAR